MIKNKAGYNGYIIENGFDLLTFANYLDDFFIFNLILIIVIFETETQYIEIQK